MTDEQIIDGLKRCFTRGFDETNCYECPFYTATAKCTEDLEKSVIDLFNRQKAEITSLKQIIDAKSTGIPEIVYCKDCKHFEERYRRCLGQGLDFDDDCLFKNENDFCSCGEREEIMEEYNENKTM